MWSLGCRVEGFWVRVLGFRVEDRRGALDRAAKPPNYE